MKLDFDSVNILIGAYDAWRGRLKGEGKPKPKPDDGAEILAASVVFMVALLQGCVSEVFKKIMRKRFPEIDSDEKYNRYRALVGAIGNGMNPSKSNINNLFARVGLVDLMDGFICDDSHETDMQKLDHLIYLRNQIAHGNIRAEYEIESITHVINRANVLGWATFVKKFAKSFEQHVDGKLA